MVERIVTTDIYCWVTPIEGVPGRSQHNVGYLGETVEVSAAEAKRGEGLGALGTVDDAAAAAAQRSEPASWGDDQLRSASANDVITYLGQHPSEAERVRTLEAERKQPRKTVAEATERVIVARDQAIADAAERTANDQGGDLSPEAEAEAMRALAGGAPHVPAAG